MVCNMRPGNVTTVRTLVSGKEPDVELLTLGSMTGLGNASLVIWTGQVVSNSLINEFVVSRILCSIS